MPAVKQKSILLLAAMLAAYCLPLVAHTRTADNSRLQPVLFSPKLLVALPTDPPLWSGENFYCAGQQATCTDNNGNVLGQALNLSGTTVSQAFSYDGVNRLTSAVESGGWSESYGYDRHGNRWVSSRNGLPALPSDVPTASSAYSSGNNRVAATSYDSAGNRLEWEFWTSAYDGENHVTQAAHDNGSLRYAYGYDGDGRRVKKVREEYSGGQWNAAETTVFVYDAFGKLAAEYTDKAVTESGTEYFTADHLGSTKLITDSQGNVLKRLGYLPFGEDLYAGIGQRSTALGYETLPDPAGVPNRFTGQYRDSETGLDYFGARYFAGALGRFTSADKPFNDQFAANPQSWNLYSYTRNNPLKYVDPQGEWLETAWDVANIVWGAKSLVDNLRAGSYGAAALDAGGVILDAAAAVVPVVPGGAGAALKAVRAAENVADVAAIGNKADNVVDAVRFAENAPISATDDLVANVPVGRRTKIMSEADPSPHTPQHVNSPHQPVQNRAGSVNGIEYSGHAFDQMRNRGLVPSVVENALETGTRTAGKTPGTTVVTDAVNKVKVVINSSNKVITVE